MTRRRAKPARPRRASPAGEHPPFPPVGVPLLGTMSDRILAAQLGVPCSAVTAERKRRRIKQAPSGRRPRDPADNRSERVQALVTPEVLVRIDAARGTLSRSDWAGAVLERALDTAPAIDPTIEHALDCECAICQSRIAARGAGANIAIAAPPGGQLRYHGDDMQVGQPHPMLPPGAVVTKIDPATGIVEYQEP